VTFVEDTESSGHPLMCKKVEIGDWVKKFVLRNKGISIPEVAKILGTSFVSV
jgi:transcriptional regulator